MACPKTERCPLYPEFKLGSSLRIWQTHFCNTDAEYERCQRYIMSESGQMPNPRMLPNGEMLGSIKRSEVAKASE